MTTVFDRFSHREPLSWRETISHASHYSFAVAALWAAAFVLWELYGAPHP